uniref:Uncharacterized protein n=1 Tax=Arundo donax TaxID=35708 RepID=A0A0A9BVI6_ARUDO
MSLRRPSCAVAVSWICGEPERDRWPFFTAALYSARELKKAIQNHEISGFSPSV